MEAPRESSRRERPVLDPASAHVPRAEGDVRARLDGGDQPRYVVGVVREVAVHLQHELGAVREHAPEARDVRRPEPFLALAVEDRDPVVLGGEPVGDLTRPVGGVVVDDEDVHAVVGERPHHRLEVLALVVGGQADDGAGHAHIIA